MPRREEIEETETRGEGRNFDNAIVRALFPELSVQQANDDGREDQDDGKGRGKGNYCGGHDVGCCLRPFNDGDTDGRDGQIGCATGTRVL